MLAQKGSDELVRGCNERVLPVIPQLIMPLKQALKAGDPATIILGLHMLQALAQCCAKAGAALLPYYRQLLPPLNRWAGGVGARRRHMAAADSSLELQNLHFQMVYFSDAGASSTM